MPFPVFEKKDEIPKGFESEYEEKDGKWHAKVPDVAKLEETLSKVRTEKKDAEKAAREANDKAADFERKLAAASTNNDNEKVTKALKKFDDDLASAKADYEKKLQQKDGELRTLKLDDKVKAAFLKAGGRPERADKALRDTKDRFDLADDGRIIVKDAKGEPSTATVEDFFGKTYKAEMAEFYAGTKASGGGAKGGAGTATQGTGAMTPDDIIANPLKALQTANAEA